MFKVHYICDLITKSNYSPLNCFKMIALLIVFLIGSMACIPFITLVYLDHEI